MTRWVALLPLAFTSLYMRIKHDDIMPRLAVLRYQHHHATCTVIGESHASRLPVLST